VQLKGEKSQNDVDRQINSFDAIVGLGLYPLLSFFEHYRFSDTDVLSMT